MYICSNSKATQMRKSHHKCNYATLLNINQNMDESSKSCTKLIKRIFLFIPIYKTQIKSDACSFLHDPIHNVSYINYWVKYIFYP